MSDELSNPIHSAAAVREENDALDRAIVTIDYPPALIHRQPPSRSDDPDPWTLAEQLCHVAEFQGFFRRQLEAWLEDPSCEIGRTHEHAERLAAVAAAEGRETADLLDDVRSAADGLASTLARLDDEHLAQTTNNVKYGAEPLTAFLDRYLIGHKRAHVDQLQTTLKAVQAGATWGGATRTPGQP